MVALPFDLSGVPIEVRDASRLRVAYFNPNTSSWEVLGNSTVAVACSKRR